MRKRIVIIGLLVALLISCGSTTGIGRRIGESDDITTVGIIGAMEVEVAILQEAMEVEEKITTGGISFYKGTLDGVPIVLAKSGIGKVSAGACAQLMITLFGVDYLINSGVAGGFSTGIQQGDIVISTDAVQHDFDTTVFGDPLGEIAGLGVTFFQADPYLIAVAESAASKGTQAGNFDGISFYSGRIASGDQFIAGGPIATRIKDNFSPLAVEMEGAAIAQIAYVNEVPFVIIRAISDSADGGAVLNYQEFVPIAARNASTLLQEMVRGIGQ